MFCREIRRLLYAVHEGQQKNGLHSLPPYDKMISDSETMVCQYAEGNRNPETELRDQAEESRRQEVRMFGRKKIQQADYDRDNWKPVLKCSICNGERVAGFKNIHTGEFKEELFIRDERELEEVLKKYAITDLTKEY